MENKEQRLRHAEGELDALSKMSSKLKEECGKENESPKECMSDLLDKLAARVKERNDFFNFLHSAKEEGTDLQLSPEYILKEIEAKNKAVDNIVSYIAYFHGMPVGFEAGGIQDKKERTKYLRASMKDFNAKIGKITGGRPE